MVKILRVRRSLMNNGFRMWCSYLDWETYARSVMLRLTMVCCLRLKEMELGHIIILSSIWWYVYHTRRCLVPAAFSIRGRLLDHDKINKDDTLKMAVDYLGADIGDAIKDIEATRGDNAKFQFLERLYT